MKEHNEEEPKRVVLQLSGTIEVGGITGSATLSVIPADRIEVEDATTLQYLRLWDWGLSGSSKRFPCNSR